MTQKLIFYTLFLIVFSSAFVASQITNIECNQNNQGRHFPSGLNCSSYFTCFNGCFQLQNCPSPFWFNYVSQDCTVPEQSGCTLGPDDGLECNSENQGRHFPTTYNCSSYFTCFNEVFYLQNCPYRFSFVYEQQACMYFQDYDCNIRETTESSNPTPPTITTTFTLNTVTQ